MLDEIITTSISTTTPVTKTATLEEEKDIYLDHCHQDIYYEEVIEDEVDGDDAVALYNQFFVQQAKLSREMEKKQHSSTEQQQQKKKHQQSSSNNGNSGDGEETAEEDLSTSTAEKDASAEADVAVVFQIQESKDGKEEIKVPLKERMQEEENLLQETTTTTKTSPKSPSRKKYKESISTTKESSPRS